MTVKGPVRFLLRLLSLLVLLGGLALFVMIFYPGPGTVADLMGESCSHDGGTNSEQCTIFDVASISFGAAPVVMLVGLIGVVALRPPGRGPVTLDLRRR